MGKAPSRQAARYAIRRTPPEAVNLNEAAVCRHSTSKAALGGPHRGDNIVIPAEVDADGIAAECEQQ